MAISDVRFSVTERPETARAVLAGDGRGRRSPERRQQARHTDCGIFVIMNRFLATITPVLFGALLLAAAAQEPAPIPRGLPQSPAAPLVIKSTYGADLYQFYCSSCHGVTAHGGNARSAQHPPAPDLTALARQNGGVFPRERIRTSITFGPGASDHGAHGIADMPVWGTVFRGLDKNDTMTAIRIENLVNYLALLQDQEGGR